MAGLELDPWQQLATRLILSRKLGGNWAAFIVALIVPRQNGKGGVLETRELAGLFLLGERLIIHTAHQFDTSLEAFYRLRALIENTPAFHKRIRKIAEAHGKEGFTLKSGQRLRYRARTTRGGGRGFTGDLVVVDEAMEYPDQSHGALLPTLSARPNPQVILAGSAVDQRIHKDGLVFAAARARGLAGDDDTMLLIEFSAAGDINDPASVLEAAKDPGAWAAGNPALGYRITEEYIEQERRALSTRSFAVERLGIGDWPDVDDDEDHSVIGRELWAALEVPGAQMTPARIAVEVQPDFSTAALCVAGDRPEGGRFVDVVDHRAGTGWVIARAAELIDRWNLGPLLYRDPSAFTALLTDAEDNGVAVQSVSSKEQAQASVALLKAAKGGMVRHRGDAALDAAVGSAATKPAGEAWKWALTASPVDITPLWAVSLALWSLTEHKNPGPVAGVI